MIKPLTKYLNIAPSFLNQPICLWCGKKMKEWDKEMFQVQNSIFDCIHYDNNTHVIYRFGTDWRCLRINDTYIYQNKDECALYDGDFQHKLMDLSLTDDQWNKPYLISLFERAKKLTPFQ